MRSAVTEQRRHAPNAKASCACGNTCAKCQRVNVHDVISSPGHALDARLRAQLEPRFGHDFSRVRVHVGAAASASARAANAHAYTVGEHVVFGAGRYAPESHAGAQLLAHELAHVVQQQPLGAQARAMSIGNAEHSAELEAGRVAANVMRGAEPGPIQRGGPPALARFSDTGHHIVEEAALEGAGFSEQERKGIERGNVERDYSQVGLVGNLLLLCKPQKFGGYKPEEHFDNYVWDQERWRTRGASAFGEQAVDIGKTPIQYIAAQLDEVASRGLEDKGLTHLGNAFHTVEDFFAHSNFVELVQGDRRHGDKLITGDPAGPSQSVPRILESITSRGVREQYRDQSEAAISAAGPGSHTRMAHDDPTTHNYTLARRLAALVIQDLGREVRLVMQAPEPTRSRLMRENVVSKIVRYLRPPDPNDKWWETLTQSDAGQIDKRLDEAARVTPTTVNQCMLSPLKNLEASRDSPLQLPLGIAIPTRFGNNQVWFQLGIGVAKPFPLEPISEAARADRGPARVVGAQIVGTF